MIKQSENYNFVKQIKKKRNNYNYWDNLLKKKKKIDDLTFAEY